MTSIKSHSNAMQALVVYGDEQYAEGVQNGWQQAINKLTDLIYEHRDWSPNQFLMALDEAKDNRK